MNVLANYPGSKGGSGVAKRLVSLMPPHRAYVEAFVGGGAVYRLKRPAELSILLDLSPSVVEAWRPAATPGLTLRTASSELTCSAAAGGCGDTADPGTASLCVALVDAPEWIASKPAVLQQPSTLLYLDPPYLRRTRTRLFYDCEMERPESHAALLDLLLPLPCMVMISHYPSDLYEGVLRKWRLVSYRTMTRGGPRIECCWLNFPSPPRFHDVRFLGAGFRERERIKRKSQRWQAKFKRMSAAERQVVAAALAYVDRASLNAMLQSSEESSR